MSNAQVGNVYQQIIADVVESSRVDFEEGGVDEHVLEELRMVRHVMSPIEHLFPSTCHDFARVQTSTFDDFRRLFDGRVDGDGDGEGDKFAHSTSGLAAACAGADFFGVDGHRYLALYALPNDSTARTF